MIMNHMWFVSVRSHDRINDDVMMSVRIKDKHNVQIIAQVVLEPMVLSPP